MASQALRTIAGLILLASAFGLCAQTYPSKPIKIIVPFAAGSGADDNSRFFGDLVSRAWGQPVVVENRPGGSGVIAALAVKGAPADGYTLFCGTNSPITVNPVVMKDLPYDPIKDFTAVSMVVITPTVLAVTPDVPVRSVKELIALAKSKPGALAYGSSGVGSTTHIAGEMLASMAGIQLNHVPYKSASAAYPDVFSGRVALIFDTALSMLQHIKAERVRPLAVTTPARASILPNLPTISEAGVPGYAITLWIAIYAPAGTPAPIVGRLNKEIAHALNLPAVREQMTLQGAEIAVGSPADLLAATKSDLKKMGELVKAAKIVAQ